MKPLMLHGHERSITQIKYNADGDLLFTASKDQTPNVWFSVNGERLGTFDGHQGAVWSIDVSYDSNRMVSGAADRSVKVWDVSTGVCISSVKAKSSIRGVSFSYSGSLIAYTTDKMMGQESEVRITDIRERQDVEDSPMMRMPITPHMMKGLSVLWGSLDTAIVTGHEDGAIVKWDVRTGKNLDRRCEHSGQIDDMQLNHDGSLLITASKDTTARLWDLETFEPMKKYKTERPVKSAAISPLLDTCPYVVLGGGQEAMEVTTTSTREGKFDARFFHLVFEEEFGRVKGHFGPINSLAFHPSGKGYASGGEDGYIRVHSFDDAYYQYKFDY
ncbi:eukaryotic translation initiation factor 3 subunit I [Hyalella azteca]|uniref:Eukaryotic translation initiation factor 3 subunit I n=1 Tax=Hyalella azteca TaxID=294128 RepID=A0A8B7PKV1_HYAAZ|nr:eukaryotic translation initiation factor 3 subunit I [Hyalella azteca]